MVEYVSRGIRPIARKFLQPNFLFALEFQEGFVFGRVVRRRISHFKPYPLISATGTAVDIAANTFQAEIEPVDPRQTQKSILFLSTSTKGGFPWFMHGGIGVKPDPINVYAKFPLGETIPGRFPNLKATTPENRDDTGYFSAEQSPYEEPSDFIEHVLPPGQRIGLAYVNKDLNRAHQPVLNLLFATYFFQALTPKLHADKIRAIALRSVPASFFTVGVGDVPIVLGDDLAEDWKVTPLTLDAASVLTAPATRRPRS